MARFFNVDPLTEDYMDWAPYVFSGNRVIDARELEGLEPFFVNYDMTFKENVQTNVKAYSQAAKSISETSQFILNPVETVKGLWNLGKALMSPKETASAIVDNVSQTLSDTQSTDPNVAGPALGKVMAFTAETAVGAELGSISKVSKVATVADDVVSGSSNVANKIDDIVTNIPEGGLPRIQNAANRINSEINLVGSRASGKAKATSDFDYIIPNISSKQWGKIKNSLPGARSVIDNLPNRIDRLKVPLDKNLPHITVKPNN